MMPERTAVYRLYDKGGSLLYVGISNQPSVRWQQHANEKPWWPDVSRKEVAWYGDRPLAAIEEMRAVVQESPRYNVIGPPKEVQAITVRFPGDLYEKLRQEAFNTRESMASIIVGALEKRLDEPERKD